MARYVYIALDTDDKEVLYSGEELSEAQEAIEMAVQNDYRSMNIQVEEDGSVSVDYDGNFKIMEVKVFD